LPKARPARREVKAEPIATEVKRREQAMLAVNFICSPTDGASTFISRDNEKLGKEGTSGWDTRNLTTMAVGLMISKPLCLQICTSCNFISREMRKAETSQAAGGHVGCSHVNQKQRGTLKDLRLTAG